jgi:hypothetical protein
MSVYVFPLRPRALSAGYYSLISIVSARASLAKTGGLPYFRSQWRRHPRNPFFSVFVESWLRVESWCGLVGLFLDADPVFISV